MTYLIEINGHEVVVRPEKFNEAGREQLRRLFDRLRDLQGFFRISWRRLSDWLGPVVLPDNIDLQWIERNCK